MHEIVTHQLEAVRRRITDLTRLEADLAAKADQCARGDLTDCPVIESLFED